MPYYVSRQHRWIDGQWEVEIVSGGIDYAGPDMLVARFAKQGEGQLFTDPREAATVALDIRDNWQELVDNEVIVTALSGFANQFCYGEAMTDKEIREWARREWEELPKCAACGEPLGKETYGHELVDDYPFCSKQCAEDDYLAIVEMDEDDLEDDPWHQE